MTNDPIEMLEILNKAKKEQAEKNKRLGESGWVQAITIIATICVMIFCGLMFAESFYYSIPFVASLTVTIWGFNLMKDEKKGHGGEFDPSAQP